MRNLRAERIKEVENAPLAKGKGEYLKWLHGGKLTRKEAMDANCYVCMGYYGDGKRECVVTLCPMRDYMAYNPKKIKREMSDEQRKECGDRLREVRNASKNSLPSCSVK